MSPERQLDTVAALSREAAEALLYQGQSAVRFTQDTPVLPDVWIQFAQQPNEAVDLLLNPWQGTGPGFTTSGQLACCVRERLQQERNTRPKSRGGKSAPKVQVAYNQTAVVTRLSFAEVIRVVLPLCHWWHRHAENLPPDSPLFQLPSEDPEARKGAEDAILRAIRQQDEHAYPEDRQLIEEAVRTRAATVFADSESATPEGTGAAATEARANLSYQRFLEAFRSRSVVHGNGIPPDVVWLMRVVGAIECIRTASASEIAEFDKLFLEMAKPRQERRADHLTRLDAFYKRVVRAVADLLQQLRLAEDASIQAHSVCICRRARMVVTRSREAIKADAAALLFHISCRDIAWAVVDSGIDATHPAFLSRDTAKSRVAETYDFTLFRELLGPPSGISNVELRKKFAADPRAAKELRTALNSGRALDWEMLVPYLRVPHTPSEYRAPAHEHGTHVAGIIGADCPDSVPGAAVVDGYRGMCPDIRLYDFRVLNEQGEGDEFNVMGALQFIRYLNSRKDLPVIHGVNLSLSIPHDAANYACGRTPVCDECERLTGAGVIVVAAAGNKGFLKYMTGQGLQDSYHSISITDPGNADGVITVGSTHRFQPHTYGVSYFSSRGPTGDGRAKPDIVAPGEKITSAVPGGSYKAMDGTSMAAPHVSGAAALLIARHRELLGHPQRVKAVLRNTATDLGRESYFQGAGMIDVLRALQSV